MILDFRFQPHEADFLTTPSGAVQKVISQTPSPLRGIEPASSLESALARQTTSKLAVYSRLLADFPL